MSEWRDIVTAPRDGTEVIVIQDGRRFVAQYDDAAGHWQGIHCIDGIERVAYFQEWPGRLYAVTKWLPFSALPES